jgi:putative ABC transport system permease protein
MKLVRARRLSAPAIITLALGIGLNTAVFSVVDGVLLRPLPYPQPDRLVWMAETGEVTNRFVSYANFKDWRASNQSFAAISTIRTWPVTQTDAGEPQGLTAQMVAADFFTVLGARPVTGRVFTAEDESAGALVTVVSEDFWRGSLGSDPGAVGKTIMLDGKPFQIVGIMPPGFQYQAPAPLWVLVGGRWAAANWTERDVRMAGYVIGRLAPGVTMAQARADMDRISDELIRQYPVANAGQHSVEMMSLAGSMTRDVRPALLILLCAVGLVLLIGCANVANLFLARLSGRQRELTLRAALGASRWRIIRQLFAESIPTSLAGGLAGLLLAWWSIRLLARLEGPSIPRLDGVGIDTRVLSFTLLISCLTAIAFGLAPAWVCSRVDLNQTLRASSTGARAGGRNWRAGLVVIEMALALTLLAGCGLMIRSLVRLLDSSPGFEPGGVLTMKIVIPSRRYSDRLKTYQLEHELLERVSALPGVENASISNNLPGLADGWQTDIFPEGHARLSPGEIINVDWSIVSEGYFATMRIPIIRGGTFTAGEVGTGSPVVVVDESLAREFWPEGEALGKHIMYDSPDKHEIIGIVKAVSVFGSEDRPRIKIYTPLGRSALTRMVLSIRMATQNSIDAPGLFHGVLGALNWLTAEGRATGGDARGIVDSVAREVRAVDNDLPVPDVVTMDEVLRRQSASRRFSAVLFTIFAVVALMLAAVGVSGVASYSVAQRTSEIGIRMALGADGHDVLKMILTEGLKQSLAGVLLGLAGGLALARAMKSLLYGVSSTDPATFVFGAIVLILVGLAACYIPARRATRMDALSCLRQE